MTHTTSMLSRGRQAPALLLAAVIALSSRHTLGDRVVSGVPDADGDGRGDYVVGRVPDSDDAYLFSGATGERLTVLRWSAPSPYGAFGSDVAGILDLSGDRLGDVAVSDPNWGGENPGSVSYETGQVYVYDGVSGRMRSRLESPNARGHGRFGTALSGIDDVNGDGLGDIVIGASGEGLEGGLYEGEGRAYIFDGRNGVPLHVLRSPNGMNEGQFGFSVSAIPDIDGDGIDDVIVGARGEVRAGSSPPEGRAYVFDGATGRLLHSLGSPINGVRGYFGESVSGVPDLNGDGRGDVVVGAPWDSPASAPEMAGHAYVFDGMTGQLLHILISPNEQDLGCFGEAVCGLSDVNGDALGDLVVGARLEDSSGASNAGAVYVFDGASGNILQSFLPPATERAHFGASVSRIPDLDGDGRDAIITLSATARVDDSVIREHPILRVRPNAISTLIESFYHLILDRKPEDDAVESWETGYFDYAVAMDVDVRFVPREMGRLFFLSDEYTTRGLSDEAFLKDCYWAFLSRYPRQSELDQWLGTGDSGTTPTWNRAEVMTIFAESEEFAARIVKMYPNNSGDPSRNFVTTMYIGLLDRLADKEGLEYAASLFDAAKGVGQSPSAVESSEGKGVGQSPSAVEFSRGNPGGGAGATRIRNSIEACRTQAKQTAREILASDEFQNLIDSAIPNPHSAIVARLYRAFLGRFPADHEKEYWTGELDAGRTTTDAMIDQFAAALEFSARLNQHFGG